MTKMGIVGVRDFGKDGIELLLNYWFESPEGFVESLGIVPSKMPTRAQFYDAMVKKVQSPSQSNYLAITLNGETIGCHSLSDLIPSDSAIFHAHIFKSELRGKGIAKVSYPAAISLFMERFGLQEMKFRTPAHNPAPNRLKESLPGVVSIGQELIGKDSILQEGLVVNIYKMKI